MNEMMSERDDLGRDSITNNLCVVGRLDAHILMVMYLPGRLIEYNCCMSYKMLKNVTICEKEENGHIWINYTFEVKENKTIFKLCGVTISRKTKNFILARQ